MKRTTITAIFDDLEAAGAAVSYITKHGFAPEAISVLVADSPDDEGPDEELSKALVEHEGVRAKRGAKLGAIIGGSGWGLGATVLALSGVIAAGPLVPIIAGVGALSGGVLGSLLGIGISRDLAKVYHRDLLGGAVMVGIEVPEAESGAAKEVLEGCGGREVSEVDFIE